MKKLIIIALLLSSFGLMAQRKHRALKMQHEYTKYVIDTMYTHYPAYYVLVDSVTHSLLHFSAAALYVEQTELNTSYSTDGKIWYRKLSDFGYSQKDYRYFIKGIEIFPIEIKRLDQNASWISWSYISTLKNHYKN